jgi:hypothetical protein
LSPNDLHDTAYVMFASMQLIACGSMVLSNYLVSRFCARRAQKRETIRT